MIKPLRADGLLNVIVVETWDENVCARVIDVEVLLEQVEPER